MARKRRKKFGMGESHKTNTGYVITLDTVNEKGELVQTETELEKQTIKCHGFRPEHFIKNVEKIKKII